MPDPTNAPAPEGQSPAEPAMPDYGASPEEIQNALNMVRGLNNLDTRGQYLQQIVNPQYDGQFLRQMVDPPEEPASPWEQIAPQQEPAFLGYDQQGQPVFEQQPQYQQPFDPTSLQPVFDQYANQTEERIFSRLGQMAQEQQVKESASEAARSANLPASVTSLIEQRVRDAQKLQPNRQIGDLASEHAKAIATELLQWKATPPENPAPTSAPPAGPAPSLQERPKDFQDMARIAQERLR